MFYFIALTIQLVTWVLYRIHCVNSKMYELLQKLIDCFIFYFLNSIYRERFKLNLVSSNLLKNVFLFSVAYFYQAVTLCNREEQWGPMFYVIALIIQLVTLVLYKIHCATL